MLNSVSHTSVSLFPQCCTTVLFPVKICRSGACQKSCPEELSKSNESLRSGREPGKGIQILPTNNQEWLTEKFNKSIKFIATKHKSLPGGGAQFV